MRRKTITIPWPELRGIRRHLHRLLPTPGNAIFTLIVAGALLWVNSAGALSTQAPAAPLSSTSTIPYQGRLADSAGNPVTATTPMIFRLYAVGSGGTPLWEENWTGPNSVQVSDGLFNVMLGSLAPVPQAVITSNSNLWLGITVGADNEMTPRVQLGSVPWAMQALTVPDGSITTAKIANGAITQDKLAANINFTPLRLQARMTDSVNLTTPNTWVVIPGMSITDSFAAGPVKITFCAPMALWQGNTSGYVRISIDGTAKANTSFSVSADFVGWHSENVCLHTITAVTQGSHTIAVEWMTNGSNMSVDPDRILIVEQ